MINRRLAIIAFVLIVALALVVFGISLYARSQPAEVAAIFVLVGASLVGVAGFLGGWKNFTEFLAKLGKNAANDIQPQEHSSSNQTSAANRSVAVGGDLSGTTITGDIGTLVINPPVPPTTQQTTLPPNYPTIQPNLVHPYPLQSNFTGRVQEREQLTTWLADDAHPICELVAMGGMGKSALAWVWITEEIKNSEARSQKPEKENLKSEIENLKFVMWWSFYESESSFAKFVDEALKYVSGHDIDATKFPTTYDRALELRRELQTKRVLFVLDGFERQLRAYARLDAAYQRDDATDPSREARSCVEPNAARLLQDITAGTTRAKVLITSRLPVSDLQDRAGDALAGVLERELKSLARDDAVAFMRVQGVTNGTNAEIANVCDAYGNHPLSLRLLSGLIARDTRTPGDVAAAPRHDVHADLVQRQHHVLEQSYNALPDKERTLLSRLAAFRSPMTYDALAIFNEFGDEAKFDTTLNDLQARGLLQRDKESNRYDLHPIVRRYCYDRLSDKTGIHTRLRDYFANIPMPDADKVQSVADLAPVIELYHHTVNAGRYDEAFRLFKDRLEKITYYRFGAYQLQIELLRILFPDGENKPPRLKEQSQQASASNDLAAVYGLSGQPRKAESLCEQHNKLQDKADYKKNLAIGLGNLTDAQIILGKLEAAETNLRHAIELYQSLNDYGNEARLHQRLAVILSRQANMAESENEMDVAMKYHKGMEKSHPNVSKEWQGKVWAFSAIRALLLGEAKSALDAAQRARTLADVQQFERDIIRAEWLLGAALVALDPDPRPSPLPERARELNEAHTHLTEALQRCRRIGMVDHEPDILLAWARWHRAKGNAQEAQTYAEEALSIADRCEYRLKQAEIHNFLARLALDAGNREVARKEAEIAKERAWCDGPPHCYKPALDEAEKMLKEI